YPGHRLPSPEFFYDWISDHIPESDFPEFYQWANKRIAIHTRWVLIDVEGTIQAFELFFPSKVKNRDKDTYKLPLHLRTQRRGRRAYADGVPGRITIPMLYSLDRSEVHSRDVSNVAERLEVASVVIVGAGSLRSVVAENLARAGLGQLTLIDPDTLEAANLGRHTLGITDVGYPKVDCLKRDLLNTTPGIKVICYPTHVESFTSAGKRGFSDADLVIVTTADWKSERHLWKL